MDRLRTGMSNPSNEIDGRVEMNKIRLRKRNLLLRSFQAFLHAEMVADDTGTRIRGTLGLHPSLKVVLALWFVGVLIACVLTPLLGTPFPFLLIPFGVLVAGAVGVWVGRLLARGDEVVLREFVTTTLDVKAKTETPMK